MDLIAKLDEARERVKRWTHRDERVGIVLTMGALHQGHLSLVRRAKEECDHVVATIFVNPTQFGPNEDFERYPRTLEADLEALRGVGTDLVLTPDASEMYPAQMTTAVSPPSVAATLEGLHRPGHFAGVATVVLKFLNLLPGTDAYFGEKDYQQLLVIRHMARDLNLDVTVQGCPIVREPDGLALSSRNRYLDPPQRRRAGKLFATLREAKLMLEKEGRSIADVERAAIQRLAEAGFDPIDYFAIRDAESLRAVDSLQQPVVILVAAHLGNTRLIDNLRAERSAH